GGYVSGRLRHLDGRLRRGQWVEIARRRAGSSVVHLCLGCNVMIFQAPSKFAGVGRLGGRPPGHPHGPRTKHSGRPPGVRETRRERPPAPPRRALPAPARAPRPGPWSPTPRAPGALPPPTTAPAPARIRPPPAS